MDHYQVKFNHDGRTIYGIASSYEKAKRGHVRVEDAVTPQTYEVEESRLVDIELDSGRFDFDKHCRVGVDELQQHVQREYDKAVTLSNENHDNGELHVHDLFSIAVGDGSAWYVVTAVNGKRCKVEWRGFCPDRWTDHHFGFGGSFATSDVRRYVQRKRGLAKIFSQ